MDIALQMMKKKEKNKTSVAFILYLYDSTWTFWLILTLYGRMIAKLHIHKISSICLISEWVVIV